MTLDRGTLLNTRYRIVDILGQGGMASVYKAIDENLGVEVAVKENLFTTEEYARQFRLEAVILASLRHPNMPRVTDHFVIHGQGQYLVMDYIEGEDLRQRMDRMGTLPEDEVIVIGVAICEAITYLHSRQPPVLHRDIKPGNVKIDPQGQIYLVDFGLAKVMHAGEATTTGARAMTPGYSPPEQYGTARTDHRSDIYSLGATLYSALTDALPEDGLARAMDQSELTPIRQKNPAVSKRLASVLEKALEVRPDNRYQSAEDFRTSLLNARSTTRRKSPVDLILPPPPMDFFDSAESPDRDRNRLSSASDHGDDQDDSQQFQLPVVSKLSESPNPFAPRKKKPVRRKLWAAGGLVVVLLALLGTFFLTPGFELPWNPLYPGVRINAPTHTPEVSLRTETPAGTTQSTPVASANLTATLTVTPGLDMLSTSTPDATLPPRTTLTPTVSPTVQGGGSGQIAFASDRSGTAQIWLMDVDGRNQKQLTNIPEGACQPEWSPDGTRLVFISPCKKFQEDYPLSTMIIINVDGSDPLTLPTVPGGDFDPAWSPDGSRIAFTSFRGTGHPQIHIINLDDFSVEVLAGEGLKNGNPAWSPDGKMIAYISNWSGRQLIWIMDTNGENKYMFTRAADVKHSSPTWSPDGKVIVFTQENITNGGFRLMAAAYDKQVSTAFPVTSIMDSMRDPSYSLDGQWLVFESWTSETRSNHDIYRMAPSGLGLVRLTDDKSNDFHPAWRPLPPDN